MKSNKLSVPFFILIFIFACLNSCSNGKKGNQQSGHMQMDHGILHVDNHGRYFIFEDGTPYVPVGLNHFLLFRKGSEIDSMVKLWADHGINYLRIWAGLGADPETEVGRFDERQMIALDSVVSSCKRYGVYLSVCFWNDNCILPQKGNWGWNGKEQIYNKENSPLGTTINADDLKDTLHAPSWNAMKHRYKYFVERWKNESIIIMWDLVNDSKKSDAWKQGMYNFVRKTDGSGRIITFQYNTGVDPKGEMDCGSVRVYDYNPIGNDPEEMMLSLAERIRQGILHGDPVICGEGRMNYKEGSQDALERGFLHFLWAPAAVGAAGNLHSWVSPDKWPDITEKELGWIKCYSDFCKTIDWSHFNSVNADKEIEAVDPDIRSFACRDNDEILFYLMNDDPSHTFGPVITKLKISCQMDEGRYELLWIDIRSGETIKKKKISDFPVNIESPEFKDGLFAYIRKKD